jgi:hypothetical protein
MTVSGRGNVGAIRKISRRFDAVDTKNLRGCGPIRIAEAAARAMRASASSHRNDRLSELSADWWESDAMVVRAMVDALRRTGV